MNKNVLTCLLLLIVFGCSEPKSEIVIEMPNLDEVVEHKGLGFDPSKDYLEKVKIVSKPESLNEMDKRAVRYIIVQLHHLGLAADQGDSFLSPSSDLFGLLDDELDAVFKASNNYNDDGAISINAISRVYAGWK